MTLLKINKDKDNMEQKDKKPKEIVDECRKVISPDIKGDKLHLILEQSVSEALIKSGFLKKASEKPFSTHIDRYCGRKAARNPEKAQAKGIDINPENNNIETFKFRAYPTIASDLRPFDKWAKDGQIFWCAVSNQIQDAIFKKDWVRLKELTQKKACSDFFNRLFPKLPKEIKDDVLKRLEICFKKGRESKENKGYPSAKNIPDKMTLSIKFNGQEKLFNSNDTEALFRNTYLEIGEAYNPANHNKRKKTTGKSDAKINRQMRKTSLRINAKLPFLEFDVLFNRPIVGCLKHTKLSREGEEWYVLLSVEKPIPESNSKKESAGLDWNWRKGDEDTLEAIDIGGRDLSQHPMFSIDRTFSENRKTRRQKSGKEKGTFGLPLFEPTPIGQKNYQREMDKRKDYIKAKLKLHEKAGWKSIKKIMDSKTLSTEDQLCIEKVVKWYDRALKQFQFMCKVATENQNRITNKIAQDVLNYCNLHNITDIGSPNDSFKEMKEKERNENNKDWQNAMLNGVARQQFNAAPGKLREVVEWKLKKNGIRVHRIDQWRTSQRCTSCRSDTKSPNKTFKCSGCGIKLNRSEIAVINAANLAFECSGDDGSARCCSKNGKDIPYKGLEGCKEAAEKRKQEKEEKKGSRSKKAVQVVV